VLSPGSTYTEEFAARAASVPRARTAITGFARAAGADSHQLESIRLAASEAVTNVVLHAYGRRDGSVRVSASYVPGELWLLVEDDGVGLRGSTRRGGLGVGLVLIAELADTFEIVGRSSGGTQLQMCFKLRVGDAAAEPAPQRTEGAALSRA
jgi:anti-sigma regulatory factor (Ser/Thr protein kinase)